MARRLSRRNYHSKKVKSRNSRSLRKQRSRKMRGGISSNIMAKKLRKERQQEINNVIPE